MTFRRSLVATFVALIAVILTAAISSMVTLRVVLQSERYARDASAEMSLVQDVRLQAEQLVSASRRYLLTGDVPARDKLARREALFTRTIAELRRQRGPSAGDELAKVSAAAERYLAAVRDAARVRVETGTPAAIEDAFDARILPLREGFDAAADRYVRDRQADLARSSEQAGRVAETAQGVLVALLATGLLTALVIACTVARRLLRQLRQIEAATAAARDATARRDELLAIVSHDLRAPLTTVSLGAALVAEAPGCSASARAIASISAAADRMTHLIDELVAREQLASGQLQLASSQLDVEDLVARVIALHELAAQRRGVEIRSVVAAAPLGGDRERLIQVLSNLIGNALKFTPDGGTITITVRDEAGATRFGVTDTGAGIPPEHLPRLFDRYFQGGQRPERGSLGLGLFICKRIVEAHRGRIGVVSELGRGTTVWFTVPRA